MNKEERKKYIFAQLRSLPNATQYVEVNQYIEHLEKQCKKQKEINQKAIEYIKEKQKIQYKFALSHIECDELLEILKNKEV